MCGAMFLERRHRLRIIRSIFGTSGARILGSHRLRKSAIGGRFFLGKSHCTLAGINREMLANDNPFTMPLREACAENRLVNDGEEETMTTTVRQLHRTNKMGTGLRSWIGNGLRNEMWKTVWRHAKPYRHIHRSGLKPSQGQQRPRA